MPGLEELAGFESFLEKRDQLKSPSQLLMLQTIRAEQILREALLGGAASMGSTILAEHQREGPRKILGGYFEGSLKPTLGVVELLLVALHRALSKGNDTATAWVGEWFRKEVTRYPGEQLLVSDALAGSSCVSFVGWFRERYRNPLVHSAELPPVSRDEYETWCDRAYGSKSLGSWLDHGVDPALHKPTDVGWLSFVIGAARPKPSIGG
jgi:hypothetical protein